MPTAVQTGINTEFSQVYERVGVVFRFSVVCGHPLYLVVREVTRSFCWFAWAGPANLLRQVRFRQVTQAVDHDTKKYGPKNFLTQLILDSVYCDEG